ncbi:hypothetical protein E4U41_005018 [Claviceps citrina]|nr:hypothetical protein E4U41_005018 [Claviceps citrina]
MESTLVENFNIVFNALPYPNPPNTSRRTAAISRDAGRLVLDSNDVWVRGDAYNDVSGQAASYINGNGNNVCECPDPNLYSNNNSEV